MYGFLTCFSTFCLLTFYHRTRCKLQSFCSLQIPIYRISIIPHNPNAVNPPQISPTQLPAMRSSHVEKLEFIVVSGNPIEGNPFEKGVSLKLPSENFTLFLWIGAVTPIHKNGIKVFEKGSGGKLSSESFLPAGFPRHCHKFRFTALSLYHTAPTKSIRNQNHRHSPLRTGFFVAKCRIFTKTL